MRAAQGSRCARLQKGREEGPALLLSGAQAYDRNIEILPLRCCDEWPPNPPSGPGHPYDEDGVAAGLVEAATLSNAHVDCRGRDERWIVRQIAKKLRAY